MTIYVATFTDSAGYGYQAIFNSRKEAKKWLENKWGKSSIIMPFNEYESYGAFTAMIKRFMVKKPKSESTHS